jgi:succinate dehydrogenase hydrophobic anchor subunit
MMNHRSLNSGATLRWLMQAGLGILLVFLLGVHLIVNHWLAPQSLLTYADVVRYYDISGIAWMEIIFLTVVVTHCMLGLHSIVLDLNLRPSITRSVTWLLILLGVTGMIYGVWLIRIIVWQSIS